MFLDNGGWRVMTLVASLPVLVACILSVLFLPESPRWMMMHERVDETIRDIHAAALTNGLVLDDFDLLPLSANSTRDTTASMRDSSAAMDKRNLRAEMGRAFSSSMDDNSWHGGGGGQQGKYTSVRNSSPIDASTSSAYVNSRHGVASSHGTSPERHSNRPGIGSGNGADKMDSFLDLFRHGFEWITLPLWTIYLCYGFTYYGLILFISRIYSVVDTSGDGTDSSEDKHSFQFDYQDIFTSAASECLGVTVAALVLDRCGRKGPNFSFYTISAVAAIALPACTGRWRLGVSLVGRIFAMAASGATWVMTPELFPTSLRAHGHSSAACFSRVGATLCPYLVQNRDIPVTTVGVILCLLNALAAMATLLLPETKGQTMERQLGGIFGKDRSEDESDEDRIGSSEGGGSDGGRVDNKSESSVSVDALMACVSSSEGGSSEYGRAYDQERDDEEETIQLNL
jgi:hypothetical protein